MAVTRMRCTACDVQVEAAFPDARLSRLPLEHQRFIELFVLAGGNLKEIARQAGVSYPTVRSRLDKVIAALREEFTRGGAIPPVVEGGDASSDAADVIKRL